MEENKNGLEYLYRITRDITDGLIVLDVKGTVIYVNPSAKKILDTPELEEGKKYAEFMAADTTGVNDDFHQYVLDCVYDKDRDQTGFLNYTCPDGSRHVFRVLSSYAYNEEKTDSIGIILQFSDVTETYRAQQKERDAAIVLVVLLAMISIWNLAVGIWEFAGKKISSSTMTQIVEAMGAVGAYFLLRKTSITKEDLGLKFKGIRRYVIINGSVSVAIVLLMILVKFIMRLNGVPSAADPLINFSAWGISETIYPITVVIQEFLTRSVVQSSVARILPWKNSFAVAIALSTVFFGALHIHKGLGFMIGSCLLLSVFGIVYHKQRTIWPVCIPHYLLGLSLPIILGIGG